MMLIHGYLDLTPSYTLRRKLSWKIWQENSTSTEYQTQHLQISNLYNPIVKAEGEWHGSFAGVDGSPNSIFHTVAHSVKQ